MGIRITDFFKNFSENDIEYLLSLGNVPSDIAQIDRAADVTVYEFEGKKISKTRAIKLLGRKRWLSGLSRSAFHWSASREIPNDNDGEKCVLFDSSKLFRKL